MKKYCLFIALFILSFTVLSDYAKADNKATNEKDIYVYCDYGKVRIEYGKEGTTVYAHSGWGKYKEIQNGQRLYLDITDKVMKNYYINKKYCPDPIYYQSGTNLTKYGISKSNVCAGVGKCHEYTVVESKIYVEYEPKDVKETTIEKIDNCEALIGENTKKLINKVMKWVRIIVPIMLIGYGILDFTKSVFSNKEDEMNKNKNKFIKRIIASIIVFLIPLFVNLILTLANDVWDWITPNTCIED